VGAVRGRSDLLSRTSRQQVAGFTLIELLVVLAMFGMLLGLAALSSRPDPQAALRRDAERLQLLFALAAEEAELRARPMAWRADAGGYSFLLNEPGDPAARGGWVLLSADDQFRPRRWEAGAVSIAQEPPALAGSGAAQAEAWVEFPRDGLQRPFALHFTRAAVRGEGPADPSVAWTLRGDSQGRYEIAERP